MTTCRPKTSPKVVISIDPGIQTTGFAIYRGAELVEYGKIKTRTSLPEPLRIHAIYKELRDVMARFSVEEAAIEHFIAFYTSEDSEIVSGPDLSRFPGLVAPKKKRRFRHDRKKVNPRSMFLLKAAQTAAQLAAIEHGATVYLYTVAEWKGDSRRSKKSIIDAVRLIYGVDVKNDNVADAIMIGNYHMQLGRLKGKGVLASAQA